jgi:hypothetical protein
LYDGVIEVTDKNRLTVVRPKDLWVLAGYQAPD